jgi:hypothetical protein
MSETKNKFAGSPQAEQAWNFPLFDAIMGRRSRRFGLGMELASGPFCYRSDKEPVPLDDMETAMLVAAATATTGPILCELEYPGGMVKTIGKPYPSAAGSHRTRLFFTNDSGVYMVKSADAKMTKMREFETAEDRNKVFEFYDQYTVKIQDGRMDLPPREPALFSHNHWVTNRPGTTLFMPVTDVTKDLIKFILNMCDSKAGRYVRDTGGYYIVDDRKNFRPAGCEKWGNSGFLNKNKILPLSRLEHLISTCLVAEGAFMGQNMLLALQAIGLGGWLHGGFNATTVLGGTPLCKGLGFRFAQSKSDPIPNPVGIPGLFESYCPPFFKDMDSAVDAAIAGMRMSMDEWEGQGMLKPHNAPNAEFDAATIAASDEGIACTKAICRYIYEEYGKFPANNDAMQLLFFIQAHHLDLDFYDQGFKEGSYLQTHRDHFVNWHGDMEIPRRPK